MPKYPRPARAPPDDFHPFDNLVATFSSYCGGL
jgi:hypothetical protein